MAKLKEILEKKSNNYSHIEASFRKKGLDLLQQNFTKVPSWLNIKISVIMPCYNSKKSLPKTLLAFESQSYRNFEVIVVEDGSPEDSEEVIKKQKCNYDLKYIKNKKNRDRSYARNTGICLADGEVILVTDPDMIPNKNYLLNLAIRQALTKNCVFLAFREGIEFNDPKVSNRAIKEGKVRPNYKDDWRWANNYDPEKFLYAPNFQKIKGKIKRKVQLLKETNYLKKLGKNKVVCCWDAPCFVVGHGMCFKKDDAIKVGAFLENFKGWGSEDIAFGAKMIGGGSYVIPCIHSTAYHLNHNNHSGSMKKKLKELRRNISLYNKMVHYPLSKFTFKKKKIKFLKQEKNKFYYRGP